MEKLSQILKEARTEIEKELALDQTINFLGKFYLTAGNNTIIFATNEKHTETDFIIQDNDNGSIIYTKTLKASTTGVDFYHFIDNEIIIIEALESIENGWQDDMVASGSKINFFDYNSMIDDIRQRAESKGIKATIEATFSGLAWTYNR